MVTCCAVGCSNSSHKGKFKLYRLPVGKRDKERLKIWMQRIGREKWMPNHHSRLCEAHFTEDQFENKRADKRRLLKNNAVPSIFSHRRTYKKRPKIVHKSEPSFYNDLEPNTLMTPVSTLDMIVQMDPTTFITPDIESSESFIGIDPGSSMAEPDISSAMTCEIYPADAPQSDSLTVIKEEPLDPDTYNPNIISATSTDVSQLGFLAKIKEEPIDPETLEYDFLSAAVKQEPGYFSEESFVTSNQNGSLFQPPVLIKEEPVSSEEES